MADPRSIDDVREEELLDVLKMRLAKCRADDPSQDGSPYMRRAKKVFVPAVGATGGASAVASLVPCDESNIRLQMEHPKRSPLLAVVYVLSPDAMDRIADDIKAAAAEKRATRRAG